MPASNTYEPISSVILSNAVSDVTFGSIPQTYTDLILISSSTVSTSNGQGVGVRFNSDSGTNYSHTVLYGTGSSALSSKGSNTSKIAIYNDSSTSGEWSSNVTHIMNYSNTTTYKTVISRGNIASVYVLLYCGLWRSTAAINTISILPDTGNLNSGSTFTLYGVKSA